MWIARRYIGSLKGRGRGARVLRAGACPSTGDGAGLGAIGGRPARGYGLGRRLYLRAWEGNSRDHGEAVRQMRRKATRIVAVTVCETRKKATCIVAVANESGRWDCVDLVSAHQRGTGVVV